MSVESHAVSPVKFSHPALFAFLAGLIFFVVALLPPDLLSGAIPFLLEGRYTFGFRSLHASTVAAMFIFIIAVRTFLVWGYARWANPRGLFAVRTNFTLADGAWCVAAAVAAIAARIIDARLTGEALRFTWTPFIRYWGVLPGIGNTILQYAYYVTEGFAIVWIADAFQNSGEFAFPRLRIPWGAFGLAATWGVGHYLSKDLHTAIYAVFISAVVGVLYLADRKSVWPSLIFWLLMTGA